MAGEWQGRGMGTAWTRHGHGMASVNQTLPHCVTQMGKTHSKPLAARHGRGMTWTQHAMCESALTLLPHKPSWWEEGLLFTFTTF